MRTRKLYPIAGLAIAGALAGAGAAVATAGGEDHPVGGPDRAKARAAAVTYLRGGRGGAVELDGEHGAKYDVEVHGADGSVSDVWLDDAFRPITSERDSERN